MVGRIALCKKPICARSSSDGFRAPATAGSAGEPAVAPNCGGITVFHGFICPKYRALTSARLEDLLGSKSEAKAVLGVLGWGWEDRPRWSFVNGYRNMSEAILFAGLILSGN